MKLETREVQVVYRGEKISCNKTVYACQHCDFELHLDWMKKKLDQDLKASYEKKMAG